VATTDEPAWLLAKVDQRLTLMREKVGEPEVFKKLGAPDLILTPLSEPLTEPTPEQLERWDRTCDNCGKYCPHDLWTGSVSRDWGGLQVVMTFGVCPDCKEIRV
jgi:hypothetical protein